MSNLEELIKDRKMVLDLIKLIRVKQWAKNTFIFIPFFFSGELFDLNNIDSLLFGFVAFSLAASAIYILNDYKDIEEDKLHPEKKNRPLASGSISKGTGMVVFLLFSLLSGLIAFYISPKFFLILSLYYSLNIAYCFILKNISILDIMIVSFGFILRIKAGGVLADVVVSEWLMVMVFLLALFLAVAKRRDDLILKAESGNDMRKVIKKYDLTFVNTLLTMLSGIIIVAYLMYSLSPEVMTKLGTHRLYYTFLFVVAGVIRYLQMAFVENNTGNPTKILYKDHFIQITILLWLLSFYLIIYAPDFGLF